MDQQAQSPATPGNSNPRKRFLLTLDADLHCRLKAMAATSRVSMSAWITAAIRESLDRSTPGV